MDCPKCFLMIDPEEQCRKCYGCIHCCECRGMPGVDACPVHNAPKDQKAKWDFNVKPIGDGFIKADLL